jgi:RNA polymerase sigma factor (sigma-70 family)
MTADPNPPNATQLTLLDSVIAAVARVHRLTREDREDFSQSVHLRMAERNYDVFVRFAGRSSLRTFLTVVVSRLLLDWRNGQRGKWRPSAEARRRGAWATELERLVFRDGHLPSEAIRLLRDRPEAPAEEALSVIFGELPIRPRRIIASLPSEMRDGRIEDYVEADDRRRRGQRATQAVARALRTLSPADRRLIGLRYVRGQSVRAIAEASQIDPRVLYRRVERVMRSLRAAVHDGCAA